VPEGVNCRYGAMDRRNNYFYTPLKIYVVPHFIAPLERFNYEDLMANPQKENGHLDLANSIVEALARTQLSGYESRILWVIWRKTYCWHKKKDWISFSQFRKLTGLKDSHISRTITRLVARNIVTKNGKSLSFQKNYQNWYDDLPKTVTKTYQNRETQKKNTKENKQKKGDLMFKEEKQRKEQEKLAALVRKGDFKKIKEKYDKDSK
jgi:phage replication O-like protein O